MSEKQGKVFQSTGVFIKQEKKPEGSDFEKLDIIVFRWFVSKRSQNIPLDGTLIKEKAVQYAKELGYNDLVHKFQSLVCRDRLEKKKQSSILNFLVIFSLRKNKLVHSLIHSLFT